MIAAALLYGGSCPFTVRCRYHGMQATKDGGPEYRNGRRFQTYVHDYVDEMGRRRQCVLIMECD